MLPGYRFADAYFSALFQRISNAEKPINARLLLHVPNLLGRLNSLRAGARLTTFFLVKTLLDSTS